MLINDLLAELAKRDTGINEGFHSLSVVGSDKSLDLLDALALVVERELRKELKAHTHDTVGSYDTPGYVNVAMIMTEKLQGFMYIAKMKKLAAEVHKMLEENKDHWHSSGLKASYTRLMNQLEKWK